MNDFSNEAIDVIKKATAHIELTNCTLSIMDIEKKFERKHLEIINQEPLVLIEKKDGYCQLYYFLENPNMPLDIDPGIIAPFYMNHYPVYADITMRGEYNSNGTIIEKLNLSLFRTYIRKSTTNTENKARKMLDTEYAELADLETIENLLCSQFDLMSDHVPEKEELRTMIENSQILKIQINDDIAGVLLFEDYGKRSYARALCVHPNYQNSFVGYSLVADYFIRHGPENTKLFYLWVDEANQDVKKLHDRFGYKFDGLRNYIFKKG